MGAMMPSGCSGEEGMSGESGLRAVALADSVSSIRFAGVGGKILRGGKRTFCEAARVNSCYCILVLAYLVDEMDLEGLAAFRHPDSILGRNSQRVTQTLLENDEWILLLRCLYRLNSWARCRAWVRWRGRSCSRTGERSSL